MANANDEWEFAKASRLKELTTRAID